MKLSSSHCVSCRDGAPILKGKELDYHMDAINRDWELYANRKKLKREFTFDNFVEAVKFVNDVAGIAESEGHHPNIYIYDYKKVRIELWTHKINGLHQNDFILAINIDKLVK